MVKAALEEVLSGQLLVGVTGVAGAGKSTLCGQLALAGRREGLAVHDLDLDQIAHAVLEGEDSRAVRADAAGPRRALRRGDRGAAGVDRRRLAARAFADPESLRDLNDLMAPAVTVGLRKALYALRGVVLLDAALLAEQALLPLCNGHVILVEVGEADRTARLVARGHSSQEAQRRVEAQWSTEEKRRVIAREIARARFGRLWTWDGSEAPSDERATGLLQQVLSETGARLERAPRAA